MTTHRDLVRDALQARPHLPDKVGRFRRQLGGTRIEHREIRLVDDLDPQCALPGLVLNTPRRVARVDTILNNSFGMLGINSTLIVRRFVA